MSESRTTSTLELVVNEQQLRNMSQIDLSNGQNNGPSNQANGTSSFEANRGFFQRLCSWPKRVRISWSSKVLQIRDKSDSNVDFALKLGQEFATIFAWSFCFLSTVIMPIIFLVTGLFNFGQCIASPALPYVVFSTGFVMTTSNLFNLALACDLPVLRNQEFLSDDLRNIIASIINVLINIIAAFLFIICAHLVYSMDTSNHDESVNPGDETPINACNLFLYHFTYWYITLTLIIILVLCLLALSLFAYNRYKLALVRGTTVTNTNTNTHCSNSSSNITNNPTNNIN